MLIEGGYVLTNAHVPWPFDQVRVVFPDGSEFRQAPVAYWDLMGDLALIGPLDTDLSPLALVDGEDIEIGSDVYLVGYPGEPEAFPQPTISRGLVSRLREWEAIGMTYLQTDAAIAGGQSGGVLVSEEGDVIGISGFKFTEANFALVASAADVLPRVERLIAGEDVAGLGDRSVPLEGGQLEHDLTLRVRFDTFTYVVYEPVGTLVRIEVEGDNDADFALVDAYGQTLVEAGETLTGVESSSATTEAAAPYFLSVGQATHGPGSFRVTGSRELVPYPDLDDGTEVAVGNKVFGSLDSPVDRDYFVIELTEGQAVEITADSPYFDTFLAVDFPGASITQILSDDDSGGGLFGTNSKITYRAPQSGTYFIFVERLS